MTVSYTATFTIPAGDYEIKVAHDGGWDTNYGVDGVVAAITSSSLSPLMAM
jgi:hypothetical protein